MSIKFCVLGGGLGGGGRSADFIFMGARIFLIVCGPYGGLLAAVLTSTSKHSTAACSWPRTEAWTLLAILRTCSSFPPRGESFGKGQIQVLTGQLRKGGKIKNIEEPAQWWLGKHW